MNIYIYIKFIKKKKKKLILHVRLTAINFFQVNRVLDHVWEISSIVPLEHFIGFTFY
jgi:hypothetical protein